MEGLRGVSESSGVGGSRALTERYCIEEGVVGAGGVAGDSGGESSAVEEPDMPLPNTPMLGSGVGEVGIGATTEELGEAGEGPELSFDLVLSLLPPRDGLFLFLGTPVAEGEACCGLLATIEAPEACRCSDSSAPELGTLSWESDIGISEDDEKDDVAVVDEVEVRLRDDDGLPRRRYFFLVHQVSCSSRKTLANATEPSSCWVDVLPSDKLPSEKDVLGEEEVELKQSDRFGFLGDGGSDVS
jgi:hypothetical protein